MKKNHILISLYFFFLATGLSMSQPLEQDKSYDLFLSHLRSNWDDIHDVIMRFHDVDPGLKGLILIRMDWANGRLMSAAVDSNSTGNSEIGPAMIVALEKWEIPGLPDRWEAVVPFRIMIVGSNDPRFNQTGILTGKVTDPPGSPVSDAMIILTPLDIAGAVADTCYTNREGIFIRTLISPGNWKVDCIKPGYRLKSKEHILIEKGVHVRKEISISK